MINYFFCAVISTTTKSKLEEEIVNFRFYFQVTETLGKETEGKNHGGILIAGSLSNS